MYKFIVPYKYIVPYNYIRCPDRFARYSQKHKRSDNKLNKIKRRIVSANCWYNLSFNKRRYNIFKNNYQIKLNFKDSSYKNKWY